MWGTSQTPPPLPKHPKKAGKMQEGEGEEPKTIKYLTSPPPPKTYQTSGGNKGEGVGEL